MSPPNRSRTIATRMRARIVLVVGLLVAAAILAGCTLPSDMTNTDTPSSLEPIHDAIPGLTPLHARGHPQDIHVTADGRTAFVPMPGTIARPLAHIAVVDLETGDLDATIDVGLRPLSLTPDPMAPHRVLVTHPYTNAITVIDTERRAAVQQLRTPYYLEHLAFSPDGRTLVATDRALDRLAVYDVTRDGDALMIDERRSIPTGPNPEHVVFVDTANGTDPGNATLVAAADRHGASITLADTQTGHHRRIPTGGPPLALASTHGLVLVAGLGPGSGAEVREDGTPETGTADIDNSLLVVDLRAGPRLAAEGASPPPTIRYTSDTARSGAGAELHLLAGATPRHLHVDGDTVWVSYHGSDQVQRLTLDAPGPGVGLTTSVLATPSGASGTRLSHLDNRTAWTPGNLTDTTHGVYETPPGPRATVRHDDLLLTVAELSEQLQVLDLTDCPGPDAPGATCTHVVIDLVADPVPYPSGTYEEGERLFVSALPSADQDRSCASCHMDGLSTGQTWTLPHRPGIPLLVPRLDQTASNAPWLLDGSVRTPADYANAAGGDLIAPDDEDPWNLQRPDDDSAFTARTGALVPTVTTPAMWFERTFAYAMGELRILPVPPAHKDLADAHPNAADQLDRTDTNCFSCHMPDGATLLTGSQLDGVPHPRGADALKAGPLAGIWDREGTRFLYDGRAATILQALAHESGGCVDEGGQPTAWHGRIDEYTCDTVEGVIAHLKAYEPDP